MSGRLLAVNVWSAASLLADPGVTKILMALIAVAFLVLELGWGDK